ncbi:MAG: hypothetical protein NC127_01990 [Muribaculum sp.]|nr:hypothetical protein [Muribaculum sp.]
MKSKISIIAVLLLMALTAACSGAARSGDIRDRNIEKLVLLRLDSIPEVEYLGLSDTHDLDDGRFQAVVIYNVCDSAGNNVERNVRVTTNNDGSEIYSWEELDSQVLGEVKKKIANEFEEKGINIDSSLLDTFIDALMKLKE